MQRSLCEPEVRTTDQPIRKSAANTLVDLVAGQLLTQDLKRYIQRGRWQFPVCNAIGDHFDGQFLRISDRFLSGSPICHDTRQFEGLRNPAAVVFPVKFNGEVH